MKPEHMPPTSSSSGPLVGCLIVLLSWSTWTALALGVGFLLGRG